jgi:two-component system response regulator YesN
MKRAQETIRLLESRTEENCYPVDKERELIGKVRIGDKTGAKKILNEILGAIFFQNAGDLEIMKARLMELVVLLSRAAVEGGGSLDKLLGLNYSFISELSSINKFEDLCRWIVKVLDAFLDSVYETKNIKNAKILSEAMNYIRRNYNNDLSLEKVAQNIYISPYYLSHLFKEELNITFVEYLTMVRVEEAKKLLSSPSMSILAIASEVGYEDASYFSKVFKKTTGLSPNQYRNAC